MWILIVIFLNSQSGVSAEFMNKNDCVSAGDKIQKVAQVQYLCLYQGDD